MQITWAQVQIESAEVNENDERDQVSEVHGIEKVAEVIGA